MRRHVPAALLLSSALLFGTLASFQATASKADSGSAVGEAPREWWSPGDERLIPEFVTYKNEWGELALYLEGEPVQTKGHAFFEPLGPNGRACVSCHQPSDGMSLSVASIQQRWRDTGGKDPIFAKFDGANCPTLPAGDPASHSLLLTRGLFRISLPWPPKALDGKSIDPEFTIEVVRDPPAATRMRNMA